jgi:hypothetical protein
MLKRVSARWWILFALCQLVPTTRAAADEASGRTLSPETLKILKINLAIDGNLDETHRPVFLAPMAPVCQSKFFIRARPHYQASGDQYVLEVSDVSAEGEQSLADCLKACADSREDQCQPAPLDQKRVSAYAVGDANFKVMIVNDANALEPLKNTDGTPYILMSDRRYALMSDLWMMTNCRNSIDEFSLAEDAARRLYEAGYFLVDDDRQKEKEAFQTALKDIHDGRSDAQRKVVLELGEEYNVALSVEAQDKVAKKLADFAKKNPGAVSNDIASIYQRMAQDAVTDAMESDDMATFEAGMSRANHFRIEGQHLNGISRQTLARLSETEVYIKANRLAYLANSPGADEQYRHSQHDFDLTLDHLMRQAHCGGTDHGQSNYRSLSSQHSLQSRQEQTHNSSECAYYQQAKSNASRITHAKETHDKWLQAKAENEEHNARIKEENAQLDAWREQIRQLNQDQIARTAAQQGTHYGANGSYNQNYNGNALVGQHGVNRTLGGQINRNPVPFTQKEPSIPSVDLPTTLPNSFSGDLR